MCNKNQTMNDIKPMNESERRTMKNDECYCTIKSAGAVPVPAR